MLSILYIILTLSENKILHVVHFVLLLLNIYIGCLYYTDVVFDTFVLSSFGFYQSAVIYIHLTRTIFNKCGLKVLGTYNLYV